ncbi:transposase DNA-binding-containing protein [Cupriavidus sp. DF5525]|uniref:IS4/Tn5 family transposase DNA-binding protein n=1 Tax=Cupriavidus sp. DF5525 TaxID=3160989 RepID=UPI00345F6724
MKARSAGWGHEALEGQDLGDARRNERAKTLVTRFAANPTASIPVACNGWAGAMGAIDFSRMIRSIGEAFRSPTGSARKSARAASTH